jgi:hypothetical protein
MLIDLTSLFQPFLNIYYINFRNREELFYLQKLISIYDISHSITSNNILLNK